jgi:hypothetical protein
LPPIDATVEETLPAVEENGFIITDFTESEVAVSYFKWLPKKGSEAIDSLEPFRRTVLTI